IAFEAAVAALQGVPFERAEEEQPGHAGELAREGPLLLAETAGPLAVQIDGAVDLAGMAERNHQNRAVTEDLRALPRGETGVLHQVGHIDRLLRLDRLPHERPAEPALRRRHALAVIADFELLLERAVFAHHHKAAVGAHRLDETPQHDLGRLLRVVLSEQDLRDLEQLPVERHRSASAQWHRPLDGDDCTPGGDGRVYARKPLTAARPSTTKRMRTSPWVAANAGAPGSGASLARIGVFWKSCARRTKTFR